MAIGPLIIDAGVSVGAGIAFFGGAYGVVSYPEMPPPVIEGYNTEDPNAIVNGSIGITITDSALSGIAIYGLTGDNLTFCQALTVGEYYVVRFGTGSTNFTVDCQVTQLPDPGNDVPLIFYLDPGVTYPATCNYPFYIL